MQFPPGTILGNADVSPAGVARPNSLSDFGQALADLAGITFAEGDILFFDGANLVKLPAGTDGHFLRLADGIPDWEAIPGGGDMLGSNNLSDVANADTSRSNIHAVLSGHLFGLTLSNGSDATNDINIAVGEAADSTNAVLQRLTGALVKRLDAGWAAGTNAGMRNSAVAITNTTYHIYLVSKAGGADVDIYAHTSATVATVVTALQAESGGASYIYARRIGSIIRSGGTILAFTQVGDEFTLASQTSPLSGGAWTNSAADQVVTVPTGISVESFGQMQGASSSSTNYFVLYPKSLADFTVNSTSAQMSGTFGTNTAVASYRVRTDINGNVRKRSSDSGGTGSINCYGWIDTRGRY